MYGQNERMKETSRTVIILPCAKSVLSFNINRILLYFFTVTTKNGDGKIVEKNN